MLKILLAHTFYRLPGGEDRYVLDLFELLSEHHDVQLLKEYNEDLQRGLRTAAWMAYSKHRADEMTQRIRDFAPDVIHLHNAYPAFGPAVHMAAQELEIPLVMTVHNYRLRCPNGLMFTEGSICRRCEHGNHASAVLHDCFPDRRQSTAYAVALWLHRFVLRLQDKVARFVAPSQFVRDRLIHWGIAPERTFAIPDFVEPLAKPSPPGRFGVFIGRLSSEKGVDVLVRALAQAADPPFRIVGDGPSRGVVQELVREVGLRNTEFLGRLQRDEVHRVLEESRYLVMPSLLEETCGLAALEAMAHGRPILVSALGGLPELLRGGTGLACLPGNVADLADKIKILEEDDAFSRDAGRKAWELCRREYSPTVHLIRLQEVYESCVGRGSA